MVLILYDIFLLRANSIWGRWKLCSRRFLVRYNSDLANGIGEVYQRSIGLLQNSHGGIIPEVGERTENDIKLEEASRTCVATFRKHMSNLQFFHALEALQVLIQEGNRYIQVEQP